MAGRRQELRRGRGDARQAAPEQALRVAPPQRNAETARRQTRIRTAQVPFAARQNHTPKSSHRQTANHTARHTPGEGPLLRAVHPDFGDAPQPLRTGRGKHRGDRRTAEGDP